MVGREDVGEVRQGCARDVDRRYRVVDHARLVHHCAWLLRRAVDRLIARDGRCALLGALFACVVGWGLPEHPDFVFAAQALEVELLLHEG